MSVLGTRSIEYTEPRKSMQILNKLKQYHDSKLNSSNILPEVVNINTVKSKFCSNPESFCSPLNRGQTSEEIELSRKNFKYSTISVSGNIFNSTDKNLISQNTKTTVGLGLEKSDKNENLDAKSDGKSEKEMTLKSQNQNIPLRLHTNSTVSVNNYIKNNQQENIEIKNVEKIPKKKKRCSFFRCFGF
jgi:hypothetical protein